MKQVINEERLSEKIRVIISPLTVMGTQMYKIESQQYFPDCHAYWEVDSDGWRTTISTTSNTRAGANEVMQEFIARERRYM